MKKWIGNDNLDLFVVRNKDGDYYHDGRHHWDDDYVWQWSSFGYAKIFRRKAAANNQITRIAMRFPEYGVPELVSLKIKIGEVFNKTERVLKISRKIKKLFKRNKDNDNE